MFTKDLISKIIAHPNNKYMPVDNIRGAFTQNNLIIIPIIAIVHKIHRNIYECGAFINRKTTGV